MLIIGSTAIAAITNWDFIKERRNSDVLIDTDAICTKQQFRAYIDMLYLNKYNISAIKVNTDSGYVIYNMNNKPKQILDCQFAGDDSLMQLSNKEILEDGNLQIRYTDEFFFASTELCYIMKLSHRFKGGKHFNKTRLDIKNFEYHLGFRADEIKDKYKGLLKRREDATYKKGYSLKKSKNDFFVDNVPYKYDHDSLHEAMKTFDKPAYMYYQEDNADVMCSKDKFFALSKDIQLAGVIEECYVLALERAWIPHGTNPKDAFVMALEKVCTTITSGWFREFAYNNYDAVYDMYSDSYVNKFDKALKSGIIKPFRNSN